jgi:hypothetical protein
MGINWLGWSGNGQLLAVRAENYPRCLWIWNGLEGQLVALLVQMSPVLCARWRPALPGSKKSTPMLAFCTGVSRVYFWTPQGTFWVEIPPVSNSAKESGGATLDSGVGAVTAVGDDGRILVSSLKWSPDGMKLLLIGKGIFASCDMGSEETFIAEPVSEVL